MYFNNTVPSFFMTRLSYTMEPQAVEDNAKNDSSSSSSSSTTQH